MNNTLSWPIRRDGCYNFFARNVNEVQSPTIKSSLFYYHRGFVWLSLKKFNLASDCFKHATEIVSIIDVAKFPMPKK
ncbi:unnamed protein product [Arabidopsis halleri]